MWDSVLWRSGPVTRLDRKWARALPDGLSFIQFRTEIRTSEAERSACAKCACVYLGVLLVWRQMGEVRYVLMFGGTARVGMIG